MKGTGYTIVSFKSYRWSEGWIDRQHSSLYALSFTSIHYILRISSIIPQSRFFYLKKSKRKVQGVPQSQIAALPRPQEEEKTDKSKQAQTEQTYEKHSLFPKRGNRNTKRTEKHKNKMTHGNTTNRLVE